MSAWLAVAVGTLALLGCGAHASGAQPAKRAAEAQRAQAQPAADPARALLALLPAGADRCVIAWPARVPAARRRLLVRVSQAEPLAWLPELGVEAYASAQREHRDGPSSRVTLLWLAAPGPDLPARLEAQSGLQLQWGTGGPSCSGAACPARAALLDAHVLRIERGAFAAHADPGAEHECARLAQHAAGALEVAFSRSRRLLGELGGLPLRASSVLAPTPSGVHVRRAELMRSMAEAALAQQHGVPLQAAFRALDGMALDVRMEQVDSALYTDFDVRFDDLELAREDGERLAQAERDADAREQQELPLDAPYDLSSRKAVLAQLGYRLDRAERGDPEARRAQLNAARGLLEAACRAQPDDEGLALLLGDLMVTELQDAEGGRAFAHAHARGAAASQRWRALERQAASLQGEAELAGVLGAQRVGARGKATQLAHEILARVQTGMSYEEAERAVLGER